MVRGLESDRERDVSDKESNEAIAEGSLTEQLKQADLAMKREKDRKIKRENDIAEGKLVSADDVKARIATAANEFRSGTETLRRDVLASCPDEGRDAVAAALDAGIQRLRERVSSVLDRS